MPAHRHPSQAARLRAAIAGVVVMALLVMQAMGLVHRIVHGVWAPSAVAGMTQADDAKRTLFSHDADTCALFDQLTHADALWSAPTLSVAHAVPVAAEEVHRAWHLAHQSAGFLARGPPSLS